MRRRTARTLVQLAMAAATGALASAPTAGCYPIGPRDVDELDAVLTRHVEVDFASYATFAIPEKVVHLQDGELTDADITRRYDDLILSELARGFESRGYTRVTDTTKPADLVVTTAISTREITNVYYGGWYSGWGWWGGWGSYGWYTPDWGWYYPYPVGAVRYRVGSIVVHTLDAKNPRNADKQLEVVWSAVLNGLVQETGDAEARIRRGIEQAFAQSPYLHHP